MSHFSIIALELGIRVAQVEATVQLLDEGATVPFISRYRKEITGSLDEVFITNIRDRVVQLRELDKRRETILTTIEEQGKLTDALRKQIEGAETMAVLEDLYLPYRPKRRTKATVAKEKGLEPLAQRIFEQANFDVVAEAEKYIDAEKEVNTVEEALQGARDIMAEWINEDQEVRTKVRELFQKEGIVISKVIKGKEEAGQKYRDYFEWEEPVAKVPSHRMLAMRRGEKEMILSLDIAPPEESALHLIEKLVVKSSNRSAEEVITALKDGYKRLLKPSIETDIRLSSKKQADEEAIRVFAENLRQLLLSAPMGQKAILGIDPGFRTGCKIVCLDQQGKLLYNDAIFPNDPQNRKAEAGAIILALCQKYEVEAIAIGNGTASRETESFVKSIGLPPHITVVVVNESGASIYSASEVAREEFPDKDVTVRGAVSIGRRLMDPLAELVKIEPKSIGVGQYQHDVDQNALKQGLDDTVMSCVNKVGVELNTASKQLLMYVSGLGPALAQSIVDYRNEKGAFPDRESIKKVPRLGDKAFEQAAGFLRIRDAKNILDSSAVHPERYETVQKMAQDLGCEIEDLVRDVNLRKQIDLKKYVTAEVGLPTLTDIIEELAKPGRDPREKFEAFEFMEGVKEMKDPQVGMKLPGIVTNITNFGAFVDIGVHQDGLVHVSHLSDRFVSDPAMVVKVHQQVQITVLEVDIARKRISLSMKSDPFGEAPRKKPEDKRTQKPDNRSKKPDNRQHKPAPQRRQPQEPDGDLQAKLNMLKNKFGKE
jgi:protein Tex